MAFGYVNIEEMVSQSFLEGLEAFRGLGIDITLYCPYHTPTRWERFSDNLLTFLCWR